MGVRLVKVWQNYVKGEIVYKAALIFFGKVWIMIEYSKK